MAAKSTKESTKELLKSLEMFDRLPASAHVRLPVVSGLRACSDATVWRDVKAGRLPKPKKLSLRISAWNVGELRAALAKKAAAS